MKLVFKILLGFIGLLLLAPFIIDMATVTKLSWKEIQSYGGIKIEKPLEGDDGYHLPLICNVSGLDSVTVKPTALSSFNVYKRSKVKTDDHMIYISVSVTGAFFKDDTPKCKAVELGKLEHGHYLVYYESGQLIGEFTI